MNRRGMMIIEATIAGTILAVLLIVCVQMLGAVAAQRRAADQQQCAAMELANVLERVAPRAWAELTPEAAAAEQPSAVLRERLPGAELKVDISTSESEPDAKRIAASLRWQDRAGRYLPPMTVTTWKYRTTNH